MKKRVYQNSKDKIIDAATQVLVKGGLRALTTEAVIQESGLSKAGFFYHFKTKDDLLVAMMEKMLLHSIAFIKDLEKQDPNPVGRSLRAYLTVMLGEQSQHPEEDAALARAFLEIHIRSPQLLEKCSSAYQKLVPFKKDQGLSPEQELLVLLAIDGLWINDGIHTVKIALAERKRIHEILLTLTERPLIPAL